jgi:hypothetical protein
MMRTVDQRTLTDCLRCCVAAVLELDYEDVADFAIPRRDHQAEALVAWAGTRGLDVVYVQVTGDGELLSLAGNSLWIASGFTLRGTRHAVVYRGSTLAHDPHYSRAGLLTVNAARVFVPMSGPLGVPREIADTPTVPIEVPFR